MALLERVATLVRANLNDLIDRAENPEKMLKQVILDMQNQLMQVKTQVAITMADQLLLQKKLNENQQVEAEWVRKAELAVDKRQDDLARAAVERALTHRQLSASYRQQLEDQSVQVDQLRSALTKLESKLVEANAKSELLMAQHRRARALGRASQARAATTSTSTAVTFDRMKQKVNREEAVSQATALLADDDLQDRLLALGKEDQVEELLREIKSRRGAA
ncbi:MAG TPA: PspA/IM30 family protein [Bryobacteraceae bacterium]|nr:PspA/IM30 family protein [Bryobacteraceae bacterium]